MVKSIISKSTIGARRPARHAKTVGPSTRRNTQLLNGDLETQKDVHHNSQCSACTAESHRNVPTKRASTRLSSGLTVELFSGLSEEDEALSIKCLPSWEEGLSEQEKINIGKYLEGNDFWNGKFSKTVKTMTDYDAEYLAEIVPHCRFNGCPNSDAEIMKLPEEELIKYIDSEGFKSCIVNFAMRGWSVCNLHDEIAYHQLPETKLDGFFPCGHRVDEEKYKLSEEDSRELVSRLPDEDHSTCEILIPRWTERNQFDERMLSNHYYLEKDGRKTHYCSLGGYVFDSNCDPA